MENITFTNSMPEISISEVFELIEETAKNLRNIQRLTVRDTGLTPPQYAILHFLHEHDQRPFMEIADHLQCTRATVTGLIDTLEKKGLVARKPNPKDRRSLLATLTEKGQEVHHETPELEKIYNTCCAGLTDLENHQLAFLLNKLNNSIHFEEVE